MASRNWVFGISVYTWLKIVEREKARLSPEAQRALELLREDLESLRDDPRSWEEIEPEA